MTQEIVNERGAFADKVKVQRKIEIKAFLGNVIVFKPRYRIHEQFLISPLTNIGDLFYVPTQEIIDDLSDDDDIEQKVICFHQINIVRVFPNDKEEYENVEDYFDLYGLNNEEIFYTWRDFHRENTFSKDQTNPFHYVNLHKQSNNWKFKGMRPKSNPVRLSSRHFNLKLKGYRQALLEFKIKMKVIEIEQFLLNNINFVPKSDPNEYNKIHPREYVLPSKKVHQVIENELKQVLDLKSIDKLPKVTGNDYKKLLNKVNKQNEEIKQIQEQTEAEFINQELKRIQTNREQGLDFSFS